MQNTLIIFSRYPVPGKVKTRLTEYLGPAGAAELQRFLTERTIRIALEARRKAAFNIEVHGAGGSRKKWRRWLGKYPLVFRKQVAGDLGLRMQKAIEIAFGQNSGPVVLVGSDIADLQPKHLETAFANLRSYHVVLGPSTDGGYFLVGLQRPKDIFSDIAWSRPNVLHQSLGKTARLGLSHALIKPATDIDTPDQVNALFPHMTAKPYLSVIIPAIDEQAEITATIENVRCADSEIIVADGGSRDRTRFLAAEAGAQVVDCRRGRARQMNMAAARARGRVLLFLHADTRLPPGFLDEIFETLMDPGVILGAFRFKTDFPSSFLMGFIEKAANLRSRFLQLPYGDQAFFMRRPDFFRLGGFPEVALAEDLSLARKATKAGRIGLAPSAAITSARRWQNLGLFRTTLINYLVAAACMAGVNPDRLAKLYYRGNK